METWGTKLVIYMSLNYKCFAGCLLSAHKTSFSVHPIAIFERMIWIFLRKLQEKIVPQQMVLFILFEIEIICTNTLSAFSLHQIVFFFKSFLSTNPFSCSRFSGVSVHCDDDNGQFLHQRKLIWNDTQLWKPIICVEFATPQWVIGCKI